MKVLIVNKFLHPQGGAETYVFELGKCLESQGHEVEYFGMEHEGRIVGNRMNAYTSSIDFHNSSFITQLTYPWKIIYSREAKRKIRLVLNDFQPDVVHLNNFNFQLTPSIILEVRRWSKRTGHPVKIVFTAHDYQLVCPNHMMRCLKIGANCEKCVGGHYLNCIKGKCIHNSRVRSLIGTMEAFYWRWRKTYRQIDAIICCSHFIKQKMDTHPHLVGRTVALHNFVERKTPTPPEEKGDYVLYFGRLSEEKGIGTLLSVAKALPHVKFVFAGSGPLEEAVQGVENVQFVGFQRGEALETLIRKARFSIYPSEWYENCPFSVMESLMLGTPVIGADIGGIPELITLGDAPTGMLFESGNAEALMTAIGTLWENKALCDAYIQNCANVCFDDMAEYYAKLVTIYKRGTEN